MMDLDESRAPGLAAVIFIHNQLLDWFRNYALPFWDEHGVDRRSGGFYEDISLSQPQQNMPQLQPDVPQPQHSRDGSSAVRRGRVVARQIYVFDVGQRLGWKSMFSNPVDHGCDYLFTRLYGGEGIFHTSVEEATHRPAAPFSLYEQAFYLFALARLRATAAERYPIVETALRCLRRLRDGMGRIAGGFEESAPPSLPLKSNPHMHLLEAALAWIDVTEDVPRQQPWIDLARELVRLCLTHFRDSRSGVVREYFDFHWRPMPGDAGRIVEPGHQFEWAWLLLQWSASSHCAPAQRTDCVQAAERLVEIGEHWGVDPLRGIAINELWDDMTVKDSAAKLWPQTERVKAWCAMLDRAATPPAAERARRCVAAAAAGLMKYLRAEAPGLWHEACSSEGRFPPAPCKASSFYHVACAIDVLGKTASAARTTMVYFPRPAVPG